MKIEENALLHCRKCFCVVFESSTLVRWAGECYRCHHNWAEHQVVDPSTKEPFWKRAL